MAWRTKMGSSGGQRASGEKGERGESGTSVHMLEGAPSMEQGNEGDIYINKENGHLYGPKTKSSWPYWGSIVGLEGSKGEKGERGEVGIEGSKGNTGAIGSAGLQ